ncbi:hypothetical protein SHELI_v1c04690 [Spiroplasma helicoides]|uniref:Lipoprotein n=1 Tax=Spiroplasma helicoides TaxID=216938 RepID=A0A1B3SKG0_9MOLU|nr:hypothetical protein [Spiroplasma helicoides]AOG60420.1 hypothetical protein SHELI_v1c04690 [Spiroplasma helicoides]
MKKLLLLMSSFMLTVSAGNLVFSCSRNEVEKVNLSSLKGDDLSIDIDSNTKTAAERAVINKINQTFSIKIVKNRDFDSKFFWSDGDETGNIKIIASNKSNLITGTATFSFKAKISSDKKQLAQIKNSNLGSISGKDNLPSLKLIITNLNDKNDNLNLTESDVDFSQDPTISSAIIQAKSSSASFTGSLKVTFTYTIVIEKKRLGEIDNKDLGNISDTEDLPSLKLLVSKLNIINDNLDLNVNEVKFIEQPSTSSAIIKAKKESTNFEGSVTLRYDYVRKFENLFNLSNIKEKEISSSDNAETSIKRKAAVIIESYASQAIENIDYKFDSYSQATATSDGSLTVIALQSSHYLINSFKFTIKYKTDLAKIINNILSFEEISLEKVKSKVDQVISSYNLFAKAGVDYDYGDYKAASKTTDGSIIVNAKTNSSYLINSVKFTLKYKVNLGSLPTNSIAIKSASFDSAKSEVQRIVSSYYSLAKIDVDYVLENYKAPSNDDDGYVLVKATDKSYYFYNLAVLTIKYNKNLADLKNITLKPSANIKDAASNSAKLEIIKFSSRAKEGVDYEFGNYVQPTQDSDGSLEIKALKSDGYLYNTTKFIVKYKTEEIVRKLSLSVIKNDDLKVSPSGNLESDVKKAVISRIASVLKINVKENEDIVFSGFKPSKVNGNTGSITVNAVQSSKLVEDGAQFITNYYGTIFKRVNLSAIDTTKVLFTPSRNTESIYIQLIEDFLDKNCKTPEKPVYGKDYTYRVSTKPNRVKKEKNGYTAENGTIIVEATSNSDWFVGWMRFQVKGEIRDLSEMNNVDKALVKAEVLEKYTKDKEFYKKYMTNYIENIMKEKYDMFAVLGVDYNIIIKDEDIPAKGKMGYIYIQPRLIQDSDLYRVITRLKVNLLMYCTCV